jgi:hypothetical protein
MLRPALVAAAEAFYFMPATRCRVHDFALKLSMTPFMLTISKGRGSKSGEDTKENKDPDVFHRFSPITQCSNASPMRLQVVDLQTISS